MRSIRAVLFVTIVLIVLSPLGNILRFAAQNNDSFYSKDPYKDVYEERFRNPEIFEGDEGFRLLKQDLIDGFHYVLNQRNPELQVAGFPIWTTVQSLQDVSGMTRDEIADEVYKNFGVILTEQHRILSDIHAFLSEDGWYFIDDELANDLRKAAMDSITWLWVKVWLEQAEESFGSIYFDVPLETEIVPGTTFL
ncbi:MAG: hypothetical protein ACFFCQ_11945, partial [Promethearchaeota archaeon]